MTGRLRAHDQASNPGRQQFLLPVWAQEAVVVQAVVQGCSSQAVVCQADSPVYSPVAALPLNLNLLRACLSLSLNLSLNLNRLRAC